MIFCLRQYPLTLIILVVPEIITPIFAKKDESSCGQGWTPFKDEKCYLVVGSSDDLRLDYEKAKKHCNDLDKDSTLPCIRNEEEKNFFHHIMVSQGIENFSVWLGARNLKGNFHWEDRTEFKYTFWSSKPDFDKDCAIVPSKSFDTNGYWQTETCSNRNVVVCQKRQSWSSVKLQNLLIEMTEEVANARREINETKSKLASVEHELEITKLELQEAKDHMESSAQQISDLHVKHNNTGNLVESLVTSEIESLKNDIMVLKSDITDAKTSTAGISKQMMTVAGKIVEVDTKIELLNQNVQRTNVSVLAASAKITSLETDSAMTKSLAKVEIMGMKTDIQKNKAPPIGYIYIQYYGQPAPSTLWPSATWSDVSANYAGLFFRVSGGNAYGFGQTQAEFAPRVTSVYFSNKDTHRHSSSITLSMGSTSDPITAGGWDGGWTGLKFYTSSGEVRPRNQAVLIFKRVS